MINYLFLSLICLYAVPIRAGLYNKTDSVAILDVDNFYKEIINVPNAWIIEFYSSWCGHCVNFAPKWIEFAKDIKEWDHTIKIGALDCSDDNNIPICRQYDVMSYPSIRLFGPHTNKGDKGSDVNGGNELQTIVVNFITKKEEDPHFEIPDSWVSLSKYKGRIRDVFSYAHSKAENAVFIVAKGDTSLAPQVILDLGRFSMVYVRWLEAGENEVRDLGSIPSVIIVDRNGRRETLTEKASTRQELAALIIKRLNLHRKVALAKTKPPNTEIDHLGSDEGAGDGVSPSFLPVYMVDIENTLSYAFRHEVALHKAIDNESLKALESFLEVLLNSIPLRPSVDNVIKHLRKYVARGDVDGAEFARQIDIISNDQNYFLPPQQSWIGCIGSQSHLRGFPCGLWTLFHTISVNAYLRHGRDRSYDPLKVVEAIHGYVKYFFSCGQCSKNFDEMFSLNARKQIKKAGDEVMWLWEAHNKVNKRLEGDLSEDPKHPKKQFPSGDHCPTCRISSTSFDREKVFTFLTKFYHHNSISNKDVIINNNNKVTLTSVPSPMKPKKRIQIEPQVFDTNKSSVFNTTDVSLCVGLYLFSTLLIVCGYLLFAFKRRMRRRKYIQQYT